MDWLFSKQVKTPSHALPAATGGPNLNQTQRACDGDDARANRQLRRPRKAVKAPTTSNHVGIISQSTAHRKHHGPPKNMDAATMASALVDVIREHPYPPGFMLGFAELHRVYVDLCKLNHWRQRSWHSVGREFARLTTNGKRTYALFYDEFGCARRLRVYPVTPSESGLALKVA